MGKYKVFFGLWFEVGFRRKWDTALDLVLDWQLNLGWLHINKFKR